jgi:hypothetical protein
MRIRSLMFTGALALSSMAVLSAKSYEIMLTAPSQAGVLQLAKGEYRVKLEGGNAVFTSMRDGKKYTTPVKVENAQTKFEQTAVEATDQDGTSRIRAIELGGSTTQLDFGD